ncbi:MAG: cellulase family glycosylhydrolase [Terriglobia bacterium]|jgi:endoglycosylceramidase
MSRFSLMLMLAACLQCGAAQPAPERHGPVFVKAAGMQFLDASGMPLLLHGINVINKSKDQGYVGDFSPADFAAIRSWGMNCVRLGIIWDGLEPQPGRIDEDYLERVGKLVGYAKAEGLYVLLDMHQDLYSVKFSDGAPAWATLDEGKPHTVGAVWSDAYYASAAVQTALDHFWENAPGPDGVGLQDHYAKVWQRVARRFRDEPAVIGYDLMNEPFPGRDALRTEQAILRRLAELLAARKGQKNAAPDELFAMMATPDGRRQITRWLNDISLFTGMMEAGTPIMQDFERGRLMPMYARVRRAIRQVDAHHILFLEPSMSANAAIPSALEPLTDDSGRRDPQQAYAPHGYDIVVDTNSKDLTSNQRVALIFRRHAEFAGKWKMPMLVGEWGAYYDFGAASATLARFAVQQFDALGCGDMYWAYRRELGRSPLLPSLARHPGGGSR